MSQELYGTYPKMPAAQYHAHREYIGSSILSEMDRSAKHFLYAWTNPQQESTTSQDRGTFFHDLILEQSVARYVARPLNEKGELVRSNSKEYAAFIGANADKIPIHPNDFKDMSEILTAFCENKKALAMMKDAKVEHSIFTTDKHSGLKLKARPDIWGLGYLADLKSTSDLNTFEKQIFSLMYDVRIVHYAKVIENQTGEKIKSLFFTAFESTAPYCSENFTLSKGDRSSAEDKWQMLINQISVCNKEGNWPGPSDDIREAKKPKFMNEEALSFEGVG